MLACADGSASAGLGETTGRHACREIESMVWIGPAGKIRAEKHVNQVPVATQYLPCGQRPEGKHFNPSCQRSCHPRYGQDIGGTCQDITARLPVASTSSLMERNSSGTRCTSSITTGFSMPAMKPVGSVLAAESTPVLSRVT